MTELPEDIAKFITESDDATAKKLRAKYNLGKPLPEWLTYTTYLHHDPDEYQAPDIFAKNGITLRRDEWDDWEERIGRPFYEVSVKWKFNTRTHEVVYLEFDGKPIGNA